METNSWLIYSSDLYYYYYYYYLLLFVAFCFNHDPINICITTILTF